MKFQYILISILFFIFSPLSAEEKHPHSHSEKTKESHAEEGAHSGQENEGKDEHGHSHDEEKKGEGGEAHEDHKDHSDEKESHEGEENKHSDEGHEEGEGHEEEEFSSSVGPGNAVTAADENQGIQLSDKAQRTLEIRLQPVTSSLPKSAVVTSKEETGVYRFRDGWFKRIEGEIVDTGSARVTFRPRRASDFKKGDQIVVNGAPLLRVAELDAFAGESAGHGH